MRIWIHSDEGRNLNLQLPTGMLLNPISAMALPRVLEEKGIVASRAQALALVRAINQYRRSHPGWVLVEVESADGDHVKITV